MICLYILAFTPILIFVFFAIGRVSLFPLEHGVIQMPNFGCCSQGLLFPSSRVPDIIDWLEQRQVGFVDQLLEECADANSEIRWAMSPSVLQHVGVKSSKEDGTVEETGHHPIYSFEFERNDPATLYIEHLQALRNVAL